MGEFKEDMRIKLAKAIDVSIMEQLALGKFGITDAVLKNLKRNAKDAEELNREILKTWKYKNPGNERENLALLLYKAAEESRDIDPHMVENILKIGKKEAEKVIADAATTAAKPATATDTAAAMDKWWAQVELSLAKRVVSNADLRELGTFGFKVSPDVIDAALQDKQNSINEAAKEVIKQWGLEYGDKGKAYDDLCEILQNIKKSAWIPHLPKKDF